MNMKKQQKNAVAILFFLVKLYDTIMQLVPALVYFHAYIIYVAKP